MPVQVGQFIGTRSDFIAEPICRRLSLLQDQVQPLKAALICLLSWDHAHAAEARPYQLECFSRYLHGYKNNACVLCMHVVPPHYLGTGMPIQVPPMSAEETRVILEAELGLRLANIFDWINLDQPLGSASISQVTAPSCPCSGAQAVQHARSALQAAMLWNAIVVLKVLVVVAFCPACNKF